MSFFVFFWRVFLCWQAWFLVWVVTSLFQNHDDCMSQCRGPQSFPLLHSSLFYDVSTSSTISSDSLSRLSAPNDVAFTWNYFGKFFFFSLWGISPYDFMSNSGSRTNYLSKSDFFHLTTRSSILSRVKLTWKLILAQITHSPSRRISLTAVRRNDGEMKAPKSSLDPPSP